MSDRSDAERMVQRVVERYGRIDVLANVAGIVDRLLPVGELDDEVATARITETRARMSVAEIQSIAPGAQVQVRDRVVLK